MCYKYPSASPSPVLLYCRGMWGAAPNPAMHVPSWYYYIQAEGLDSLSLWFSELVNLRFILPTSLVHPKCWVNYARCLVWNSPRHVVACFISAELGFLFFFFLSLSDCSRKVYFAPPSTLSTGEVCTRETQWDLRLAGCGSQLTSFLGDLRQVFCHLHL